MKKKNFEKKQILTIQLFLVLNLVHEATNRDDDLHLLPRADRRLAALVAALPRRGGGLHPLCFRTDDIDADVERLRDKGYQFTSDTPTPGAHGSRVIFIHPKSCDGVLIELSQPAESHA